jgi:hypothetical protein
VLGVVVALALGSSMGTALAVDFKRGDANGDGCLGWKDKETIQRIALMLPSDNTCQDAADWDDNGTINAIDAVLLARYMAELPPQITHPPGHLGCGPDPTADALGCASYSGCAACDPPPCIEQDNGTGTIHLPPDTCQYLAPQELHVALDGLPEGSVIKIGVYHGGFIDPNEPPVDPGPGAARSPGGVLGGEIERFDSLVRLEMKGEGDLAGFERTIEVFAPTEVHTAPRTPGDAVQTFAASMRRLEGELTGDPDFDLLRIKAGDDLGLPSSGETTLTRGVGAPSDPNTPYAVASSFDLNYRIEFVGAAGGALAGLSGDTLGQTEVATPIVAAPLPVPTASTWRRWSMVVALLVAGAIAMRTFARRPRARA